MRIVTTLPSATEVVYALGLEPVGVSHECDYPPEARQLPSVTRSRIDADASSAEIDRQVLEAAADEGVYDVDIETLDRLEPDLIVTQGVCDVCAVDEVVVERAVERIDADPAVLTTDPHAVDDVLGDLLRVGRAVDREERAASVVAELESRIDTVRDRATADRVGAPIGDPAGGSTGDRTAESTDDRTAESIGDPAVDRTDGNSCVDRTAEHPRVAILDWTDPVMVAGHWTPELAVWAGGEYGLADPGDRSRPREWAEIREYDPEVLVVAPCGFGLDQTAANLSDLTDREGWEDLTAVRDGRAWAMDGHHYVNRPGPRLVDTFEYLAGIVRPDRFDAPPEGVAMPISALERRLRT